MLWISGYKVRSIQWSIWVYHPGKTFWVISRSTASLMKTQLQPTISRCAHARSDLTSLLVKKKTMFNGSNRCLIFSVFSAVIELHVSSRIDSRQPIWEGGWSEANGRHLSAEFAVKARLPFDSSGTTQRVSSRSSSRCDHGRLWTLLAGPPSALLPSLGPHIPTRQLDLQSREWQVPRGKRQLLGRWNPFCANLSVGVWYCCWHQYWDEIMSHARLFLSPMVVPLEWIWERDDGKVVGGLGEAGGEKQRESFGLGWGEILATFVLQIHCIMN